MTSTAFGMLIHTLKRGLRAAGPIVLACLGNGVFAATEQGKVRENEVVKIKPYSKGLKVSLPALPGEHIRWMVPEGYEYGNRHRGFSSRHFKPHGRGGWRFDSALERGSVFRITVTPHGQYASVEILLDNTKGTTPLKATTWGICCDFVSAGSFWGKQAYERTTLLVDGKLTSLKDTDRSSSLNREMPVYSVKGVAYPTNWAQIVANGYGWGLSRTVADNSFICIASKDGRWVLGTFFDPVRGLSFNTKGNRIHGCIHSNPYLGAVPRGKAARIVGRLYLFAGTPQDLRERYEKYKRTTTKEGR